MIKFSNYQFIQGKVIKHPKGNILKTLDNKKINFNEIKEIYFSWVANKKIKAWKYHKKMMIFVAVPHGSVKFVFFNRCLIKLEPTNPAPPVTMIIFFISCVLLKMTDRP